MFVTFGSSHIAALAFILAASACFVLVARHSKNSRTLERVRWGLASSLIAAWIWWFVFLYEKGWLSIATVLPMHLCDWTSIVVILTLISLDQRTYDLSYFWAFGTLQALLTPDLAFDFPDQNFLIFFVMHGVVLCSILLLTLGLGMRPRPSSIPRVVLWSLVYLVSALCVDALSGANFGYLMAKPKRASLLDVLAPWPYYIGEIVVIGALVIVVLYAPFFILDRMAKKSASARGLGD